MGLAFGDIFRGIDPQGNIRLFQDRLYASRPGCVTCPVRESCLGGCPAINLEETGSVVTPAPSECQFTLAMTDMQARVRQP